MGWTSNRSCGNDCNCTNRRRHPIRSVAIVVALLLITAWGLVSGCNYSLSGATVAADVQTFSVELFENQSQLVSATLSAELTQQVRDKFQSQSRLRLVQRTGDVRVSGVITDYFVAPTALQSSNTAAQSRLTVRVRVRFENVRHPEDNFDQDFQQFFDFPGTNNLSQVEQQANQIITERLAQDIFNKALSNW